LLISELLDGRLLDGGSHLLTSELLDGGLLDGGSHLLTSELLDGGLLDERRKTCEWANNVKAACFFFLN
jgi:hypothetical protein